MQPSARALLEGIIDYAGLFPPARLPMDEALRNYLRYRRDPDRWMLSRFVCPTSRFEELLTAGRPLFPADTRIALAALGRGGNSSAEFLTGLQADLEAIAQFGDPSRGCLLIDVLEVKLPPDILWPGAEGALRPFLAKAIDLIEAQARSPLTSFFEAVPGPDWEESLTTVIDALAWINDSAGHARSGYKLRCGGLEPSAFPTPEQVACTIHRARDRKVPLKFTAGLHHPLRHFDAGLQTMMHGFLNVFGAGVLAFTQPLDLVVIRAIVEEQEPNQIWLAGDELGWKNLVRARVEEITAARLDAVVAFGSCSFDEPREDLRALGLLP